MAATLDTATIRRAVKHLRRHAVAFRRSHYSVAIDPFWLQTPERRRALWDAIERMVHLDETYGAD